jgi:AcrR family transcriptional regulator
MSRKSLIVAVVEELRRNGIADRSLREIAAAVGSSHRMLLYHFGSRDGLLAAVVTEVERRERERSLDVAGRDPADALAIIWDRLADPARADEERLFFELVARAVRRLPGTEELLAALVEPWLATGDVLADALSAERAASRPTTRLDMAVVRGLLLDLLATGDRAGVDAAFARYLTMRSRPARR